MSGVKLKVLAEATGVSRQAIYHARKHGPSLALARKAAPILGVPWHDLIDVADEVGAALEHEPVREREEGATEPQG